MSLRRAPWLLLLALVCCADEPLTQIVVVVDSDYGDFSRVEIEVGGFGQQDPVRIDDLSKKELPRRLTLVHGGGPLGPIRVTARAYVKGSPEPVLSELRSGISFEHGKTRMLKIDLLWRCIMRPTCPEACVDGECVSSEAAASLQPWDPKFDPLDLVDGGDPLMVLGRDAASGGDAEPPRGGDDGGGASGAGGTGQGDAMIDGAVMIDAGPPESVPVFTYAPSNFDPTAVQASADQRPDVALDCPLPQFDSKTLEFVAWCGPKPLRSTVTLSDGNEAVLLVMNTFSLSSASTLQLSGDRPIILAVFGDAQVFGTIDVSAHGEQPGPGAPAECGTSLGSTGASGTEGMSGGTTTSTAAGGGSGGGFGSAGGRGGAGGGESARVDGGTDSGDASLRPLRGGCPGGRGGSGDSLGGTGGGGGGAIQISAAGTLQLVGEMIASGGGGQSGSAARDGGGGGGSGGAVLLEGARVLIDSASTITANGGGGAGGQPSDLASPTSTAGGDGPASATAAIGGTGSNSGGDGGLGATGTADAGVGEDGMTAFQSAGGGGGGGGGVGRIRVNRATDCGLRGVFSPAASIECPTCADMICPPPPPPATPDCSVSTRVGVQYYLCADPLGFDDARAHCQDLGRDLVHIDSQSENDWLDAQLSGSGATWVWIGATDIASEGDWRWVDDDSLFWFGGVGGTKVGGAFTAWLANEPNGTGDCARLEAGDWYDSLCTTPGAYFCE